MVLADFGRGQGFLSTHGATPFPLTQRRLDTGELLLELQLGHEVVLFRALDDESGLRGTAVVNNMEGRVMAEGEFLLRRLPNLVTVHSRDEGWRQDLEVVLTRFLPYDRSLDAGARKGIRERIDRLKNVVSRKSDAELMVELSRTIALGGNAHTRLYLVRNRTEVRRLPIRIWWFKDGFYVVRTTSQYRSLQGCRVDRIGGTPIAVVAKRVDGIKPGNASWQRYMASYLLTSPEILIGSRILRDTDRVSVDLRCSKGRTRNSIEPLPLHRASSTVESWWDLAPSSKRAESVPLSVLPAEKAPLYLRKPDVHYWSQFVSGPGILYVQYNRAQEMSHGPSLESFGRQLLQAADRTDLSALVLDLRFNTGGNGNLATSLMKQLRKKLNSKPVFVITGRATFSAGVLHTAQWKEWGATLVGEPVADELDWWAEGGNVELPNSKLTLHYSNGFHGYSKREYPERRPYFVDFNVDTLAPDLPAEPTFADYVNGRDPALEKIEAELSRRMRKSHSVERAFRAKSFGIDPSSQGSRTPESAGVTAVQ